MEGEPCHERLGKPNNLRVTRYSYPDLSDRGLSRLSWGPGISLPGVAAYRSSHASLLGVEIGLTVLEKLKHLPTL